jgi:Ser/Thr protein kinase RdoA (MazF antagonist)
MRRCRALASVSYEMHSLSDVYEVLAGYGVGQVHEVRVAGGTAGKCWRVVAAGGSYFLRCRGTRTSSREALHFDHGLRRHLLSKGVATAAPLTATSGDTWVYADGRAFELYPFVDGRTFAGTRRELADTGRALARFHVAAAGFPARATYDPVPSQFGNAAPQVGGSHRMDDPDLMLAAYEQLARDDPALVCVVKQAGRLAREYAASNYEMLPRWLIHGDYHPGNLLYADSGAVVGIFDLDWACEHTRSRDLADGIYYFGGRRAEPFDGASIWSMTDAVELDLETAAVFVEAYRDTTAVGPEEVRAIPLALRARLLAERLEGSAKVPPEQRSRFIARDLDLPLQWLDAHGEELIRRLL